MKIDTSDPLVQRIIQDDRPIALRKRRRSVVDRALPATETLSSSHRHQMIPKTPSKSKKKVRFSDPGPIIESTTGLTPALKSTSLGAPFGIIDRVEVSWPKSSLRRRVSLPCIRTTSTSGAPIEIQFAPIRQVLTPRLKRQIARKDLSNEMNKIDDEKRLIDKQEAELRDLREELIELRKSKTPADMTYIEDSYIDIPQEGFVTSPPGLEKDLASIPDSQYENSMLSSPVSSSHDSIGIFVDPDCQSMEVSQPDQFSILSSEDVPSKVHQAMQTDTLADELKNHIAEQTAHLMKARLELEHIYPGETTLPLTPPVNGNCSPLLNAMLKHLQMAQVSLRTTKQSLSSMEAQKNSLQGNFNQSLAKLDVARESYAELLKGARAGAEKYAQARQRITGLEAEVEEGGRSSEKLRNALDTYRGEVHALESLITRLEEESKERLETLKGQMDEAVADLECSVAAETRGRREAENELDSRALQIRVLEGSQKELKQTISEKQAIIRTLEEEVLSARSGREQETGHLNVRIARLEEELACARVTITNLELEKAELLELSNNHHSKELKTIVHLKDELRRAVRGVEGIVGGWENEIVQEGDSVRIAGLMTPCVDGGRFRDVAADTVDGAVQVKRGKSRRSRKVDSAIGLLEEDIMDV